MEVCRLHLFKVSYVEIYDFEEGLTGSNSEITEDLSKHKIAFSNLQIDEEREKASRGPCVLKSLALY